MKTMKSLKWGVVLLLLAVVGSGSAWADRGGHHHRGDISFGLTVGPYWGPAYYPSPYYYPPYPYAPPVIIERAPPPVYIEQQPVAPPAPVAQSSYWYYCNASQAYYPYVKDCPGGWQKVLPQPPSQP